MRFFSYQGTDRQGRPSQGTIQATTVDEARLLLTNGGIRTTSVRELGHTTPAPSVPHAPARSSRPAVATAPSVATVSRPAPTASPAPAAPVVSKGVRYRFAGNKTSFFFFEALGRFLKSGIAPNRALEQMARQSRKAWMGERLLHASAAVAKGVSLADALEACACFPTGCIGTIRAGEASGAVPEACAQAATGCEQAHKLASRCAYMTIMFAFVVVYFPFGLATINGSVDTMVAQDAAGGTLSPTGTAASKIGSQLRQTLPAALALDLLLFAAWRVWLLPSMVRARHRAVLLMPILSGRAREESLARVSWALTELSRAGIPSNRALALAADAAPNLLIADRFRDEAARMREQDRLSVAMRATDLMSPQLIDVVENGELAGDVPGAIASVHRATSMEFERKNATAHTKIWFVLYPILGVVVFFIVLQFAKTLYLGEIRAMLGNE